MLFLVVFSFSCILNVECGIHIVKTSMHCNALFTMYTFHSSQEAYKEKQHISRSRSRAGSYLFIPGPEQLSGCQTCISVTPWLRLGLGITSRPVCVVSLANRKHISSRSRIVLVHSGPGQLSSQTRPFASLSHPLAYLLPTLLACASVSRAAINR